ncbi:Uncharacterised protein [Legionella lansingensis]|uniref:Uncharacterized protein n=1 Tax=Legionella lansingensis TaxID=45067 RepID=A0A0W0VJB9_9GAMM|nr:hypothetical protein [Legionella lansingensis]KTD20209.1 hypothetical protein Llan_1970 [Legionella lansingensis]SNV48346.1 Uncharacterised protein [Legionella lansingensis]
MRPVNNVIYNQANISSWNDDLPGLHEQIGSARQSIAEQREHLIPLDNKLQSLNIQISSLQSQIAIAQSAQATHYHYYHRNHYHSHNHHHHDPGILHTISDTLATVNIISLNTQLNSLISERYSLERQREPYLRNVSQLEEKISIAQARIQWIEKHVKEGRQFLQTLADDPSHLLTQLKNKLVNCFTDFEQNHPAGLSPQVRFCLLNLQHRLQDLFTPIATYGMVDPQYQLPTISQSFFDRICYLRLCAFILDIYQRVNEEGKDEQFIDLLIDLVNSTHIDKNKDLPDHLQTGKAAYIHYLDVKTTSQYLCDLTEQQLEEYEAQIFNLAVTNLKRSMHRANTVEVHIENALHLMELEIATKLDQHKLVDYHFYTQVLYDFDKIVKRTAYPNLINHLGTLADHASGTPSLGRKFVGTLLVIAGLLIIGASIAGLAATFGSSSFFSAYGVAFGLSLLQFEISFGALFTFSAIAGSSLTFFGSNTFKSGMRQSLSLELTQIQEDCRSLENSSYFLPEPSAPPMY